MDKPRVYLASTAVDDLPQVAKAKPDPKQVTAIVGAKGTGLPMVTETMDFPWWLAQKMAYCFRKMESITQIGKRGRSQPDKIDDGLYRDYSWLAVTSAKQDQAQCSTYP